MINSEKFVQAESRSCLEMPETQIAPLHRRIMLAASGLVFVIALTQIIKTSSSQWYSRPDIPCEQGVEVHQLARINADRVNLRDLPTVFSTVLTQANAGDPAMVVCVFGAWSQLAGDPPGQIQWVSTGLITPDTDQPLSLQSRVSLILMALIGALWLAMSALKPTWLPAVADWLFKTRDLPPHAQPLIKKSVTEVPLDQQLRQERI